MIALQFVACDEVLRPPLPLGIVGHGVVSAKGEDPPKMENHQIKNDNPKPQLNPQQIPKLY